MHNERCEMRNGSLLSSGVVGRLGEIIINIIIIFLYWKYYQQLCEGFYEEKFKAVTVNYPK